MSTGTLLLCNVAQNEHLPKTRSNDAYGMSLTETPCKCAKCPMAAKTANPLMKENMQLEQPMTTELRKAGSPRGQWEPYAVMVPMVTESEKKICETARLQTSGCSRRIDRSHLPMYSSMPSEAPSRVIARKRKIKRKIMGNPMVMYATRPVHWVPKARHNQTQSHTTAAYPTLTQTRRVGRRLSSRTVSRPIISLKKYSTASLPSPPLDQGSPPPKESKKAVAKVAQ